MYNTIQSIRKWWLVDGAYERQGEEEEEEVRQVRASDMIAPKWVMNDLMKGSVDNEYNGIRKSCWLIAGSQGSCDPSRLYNGTASSRSMEKEHWLGEFVSSCVFDRLVACFALYQLQ